MATEYFDEYRISQRVVLRPGDTFRAKGGPFWKSKSGEKVPLSSKGPYKFIRFCRRGSCEWIEARDKTGAFTPLHIAGRRKRIDARLVPRPYVITGKKRTAKA